MTESPSLMPGSGITLLKKPSTSSWANPRSGMEDVVAWVDPKMSPLNGMASVLASVVQKPGFDSATLAGTVKPPAL